MSVVRRLAERGIARPPKFLPANTHYETLMGSVAYGVSGDTSDADVYGFCIPPREELFPHLRGEIAGFGTPRERFAQYQEHHLKDPDALGGSGREYDLTIYNVVDYFHLLMKNNPNVIDSLFTPDTCVLHITRIGQMVRDARKTFLHKGCWHTFKGYAYRQVTKMAGHNRTGKRKAVVEKYGYDCYLEEETEFLTEAGWKRFDDIPPGMHVAGVDVVTNEIRFAAPVARVDKRYTGKMFVVEPALSRCVVTPGHQMLVSPARRNPATKYSYKFFPDRAKWQLIPFEDFALGARSWYHVRRCPAPRAEEYPVEDDFLKLAGLFVSEGSIGFRDGKVKAARVTQTRKGKPAFYAAADGLAAAAAVRTYHYEKESIWVFCRETGERLYREFGHGSRRKRLPPWTLQLSHRQAKLFWDYLCLGDGTPAKDVGDVYCTVNADLAGDIQAMMVAAGFPCSIRGRFESYSDLSQSWVQSYQVYVPDDINPYRCVDFKRRILRSGEECGKRRSMPIKEIDVADARVVCFTHPAGTLVTRSGGKVAVQGNCKFAYHVVRLLNEVEQILTEGDLDLMRNREQLKSIRRGDWTEQQVRDYFTKKEAELETLYQASTLPPVPDEAKVRQLLLHCLEEHYGSLEKCVVNPDAAVTALREVATVLDRYRGLL